ncbi:MAG: hypothetical protein ACLUI3_09430 [Christensenellales bacterium]
MKRGWLIFFCVLCLCLFGCAAQSGGGTSLPCRNRRAPEPDAGDERGAACAGSAEQNESGVPMLRSTT